MFSPEYPFLVQLDDGYEDRTSRRMVMINLCLHEVYLHEPLDTQSTVLIVVSVYHFNSTIHHCEQLVSLKVRSLMLRLPTTMFI